MSCTGRTIRNVQQCADVSQLPAYLYDVKFWHKKSAPEGCIKPKATDKYVVFNTDKSGSPSTEYDPVCDTGCTILDAERKTVWDPLHDSECNHEAMCATMAPSCANGVGFKSVSKASASATNPTVYQCFYNECCQNDETDWGPCEGQCGKIGTQQKLCGDGIPRECATEPCVRHQQCEEEGVTHFTPMPCSASCGGGELLMFPCQGDDSRQVACNQHQCPPGCEGGDVQVSGWSECDSSCGTGVEKHRYNCVDGSVYISKECTEVDTCPPLKASGSAGFTYEGDVPASLEASTDGGATWETVREDVQEFRNQPLSSFISDQFVIPTVKFRLNFGHGKTSNEMSIDQTPDDPFCRMGDWGTWSPCDPENQVCTRRRTRININPYGTRPLEEGETCATEEIANCDGGAVIFSQQTCTDAGVCPDPSLVAGDEHAVTVINTCVNGVPSTYQETEDCICPKTCEMGDWSNWSGCNVNTGDCTETRTRPHLSGTMDDGDPTKCATTETRRCADDRVEDGHNGECAELCPSNPDMVNGTESKRWTVKQCVNGTYSTYQETEDCNCCDASSWTAWSGCDTNSCQQTRTRTQTAGQPGCAQAQWQMQEQRACPADILVQEGPWSAQCQEPGLGNCVNDARLVVEQKTRDNIYCRSGQRVTEPETQTCPQLCPVPQPPDAGGYQKMIGTNIIYQGLEYPSGNVTSSWLGTTIHGGVAKMKRLCDEINAMIPNRCQGFTVDGYVNGEYHQTTRGYLKSDVAAEHQRGDTWGHTLYVNTAAVQGAAEAEAARLAAEEAARLAAEEAARLAAEQARLEQEALDLAASNSNNDVQEWVQQNDRKFASDGLGRSGQTLSGAGERIYESVHSLKMLCNSLPECEGFTYNTRDGYGQMTSNNGLSDNSNLWSATSDFSAFFKIPVPAPAPISEHFPSGSTGFCHGDDCNPNDECIKTGKTTRERARCIPSNPAHMEAAAGRTSAGWCCNDYGRQRGFKWVDCYNGDPSSNQGFRSGWCNTLKKGPMGFIKKGSNDKCGESNVIRSEADCRDALEKLGYGRNIDIPMTNQSAHQPGCSRVEWPNIGSFNVFNNINTDPSLYNMAPDGTIPTDYLYPVCWDNVPE